MLRATSILALAIVPIINAAASARPIDILFNSGPSPGLRGLVLDGGTLYGRDAGSVYRVNMDGSGLQTLRTFSGILGDVKVDGSTLYGLLTGDGAGSLFKMNTDGTGLQTLHTFSGADGASPTGIVLADEAILGATYEGGSAGRGTLFRVNLDGGGFQTLHSFRSDGTDGFHVNGQLATDGSAVYGAAPEGHSGFNSGTVFKASADGTDYRLLKARPFNARGNPVGGVTLQGTTLYGHAADFQQGGLFRLNADGSNYQVLHEFVGPMPRAAPAVQGGTLFGITQRYGFVVQGGLPYSVDDSWAIYSINTDGSGYRVLRHLNQSQYPDIDLSTANLSNLIVDGDTLYGTFQNAVFATRIPELIAGTDFNELQTGAGAYLPSPTGTELGFTTQTDSTGGVNPMASVQLRGSERTLTHRSISATTTFDAVDLAAWADVQVMVDLLVDRTGYEVGDGVSIYVTNGTEQVSLFYGEGAAAGDPLDGQADGSTFVTYVADVPDGWTTARLVIESASNSTTGAERFDFDNVVFSGVSAPVPEPATYSLALTAVLAVGLTRRRRRRRISS